MSASAMAAVRQPPGDGSTPAAVTSMSWSSRSGAGVPAAASATSAGGAPTAAPGEVRAPAPRAIRLCVAAARQFQSSTTRTAVFVWRFLWPANQSLSYFGERRRSQWIGMVIFSVLVAAVQAMWMGWPAVLVIPGMLFAYFIFEAFVIGATWLSNPSMQLGVSFACACIAFVVCGKAVQSSEFYKAAAQLIPVLFLAYVVEKRREYQKSQSYYDRSSVILNVLGLCAAGGVTFLVLAFNDDKLGDARVVVAPIVLTVMSMTFSLVSAPSEADKVEQTSPES